MPLVSRLPEPVPDEGYELLLALVGHAHVVQELPELPVAPLGQPERLAGLAQELDELCVVARGDVAQPGVRGGDERGNGRVE